MKGIIVADGLGTRLYPLPMAKSKHKRKNKYPIIAENQRMEIVKAIKYVDEVQKQENMDKFEVVNATGCDVVFVGG